VGPKVPIAKGIVNDNRAREKEASPWLKLSSSLQQVGKWESALPMLYRVL